MPPCRPGEKLVPAHRRRGHYRKRAGSTSRRWVRPCEVKSSCRKTKRREAGGSTARRGAAVQAVDATGVIGDGFRYVAHARGDPAFDRQLAVIKSSVHFCNGAVRGDYLRRDVLPTTDVVLVAYDERKLRGARRGRVIPLGFAAMSLRGERGVTVDAICSRGHGRKILRALESVARGMGRQYVVLYALPQVINFYRRVGYRHALVGKRESDALAKLADDALKSRARTVDGALRDQRLRKLMNALYRRKLVQKKGCVGIDFYFDSDMSCSNDGYYMRKDL